VSFRVEFSHQAAKELKRLDRTTIKRIEARIDELSQNPFNPRISQQKEMDPESRKSRVGDWRIIYQVDEERKIVNIASIRPRSRAYR
jgi:mRNA interferase RelE/StbE